MNRVFTLHTEQTGNRKGVHHANGNKVTRCILYQTRVLRHLNPKDREGLSD